MAVFESYAYSVGSPVAPRVGCDEVHFGQMESAAVLLFCVVSAGYIDYIFVYVLADNKPWAAAEPEAFSLSDGMEPVAAVLAEFTAGFYLYYRARALAEVPADEIVVVYFPEEADALRVASECVRKLGFGGDATYIGFRNVAEGEGEVCQLFAGYACEEVGLIFYGVDCRGEPFKAIVVDICRCIVPCGGLGELMSPTVFEISEFNDGVAHYVGIGSEAGADGAQCILHDVIPVFLMERYDIERQPVAVRDE